MQAGHERAAALGGELGEQLDDVRGERRVEAGDRLVGEHEVGVLHEQPGERDPLLLPPESSSHRSKTRSARPTRARAASASATS